MEFEEKIAELEEKKIKAAADKTAMAA